MTFSLEMDVEIVVDEVGIVFLIDAPWLKTPVSAATFEAAYELALRERSERPKRPHGTS